MASFDDVTPGRWHVTAWVSVEDMTQPVEVETVDVAQGDEKHVDAKVKPLIFKGQVVSGGHGVSAYVGIGADYDCDGQPTGTDCNVWYDPSCASGGGWWNGPVLFGDYNCVAFIYVGCGHS